MAVIHDKVVQFCIWQRKKSLSTLCARYLRSNKLGRFPPLRVHCVEQTYAKTAHTRITSQGCELTVSVSSACLTALKTNAGNFPHSHNQEKNGPWGVKKTCVAPEERPGPDSDSQEETVMCCRWYDKSSSLLISPVCSLEGHKGQEARTPRHSYRRHLVPHDTSRPWGGLMTHPGQRGIPGIWASNRQTQHTDLSTDVWKAHRPWRMLFRLKRPRPRETMDSIGRPPRNNTVVFSVHRPLSSSVLHRIQLSFVKYEPNALY